MRGVGLDLAEESAGYGGRGVSTLLPGTNRVGVHAEERGENDLRHPHEVAHAPYVGWGIRPRLEIEFGSPDREPLLKRDSSLEGRTDFFQVLKRALSLG